MGGKQGKHLHIHSLRAPLLTAQSRCGHWSPAEVTAGPASTREEVEWEEAVEWEEPLGWWSQWTL